MNPWGLFIAAVGIILVIAAHKNAQGALLDAVTGKASPAANPQAPPPSNNAPGSNPPPVVPAVPPTPNQPVVFGGGLTGDPSGLAFV